MTVIEAPQQRSAWLSAQPVALIRENARTRSITLQVPGWPGHRPGQHLDLRLTAEDGYQAARSYSIASVARGDLITITVERVENGEVSPYLVDELQVGDRLDVRGPIGGHFVWTAEQGGPVLLVAGGSGVVPLMSMVRHRFEIGSDIPITLLYSLRAPQDLIYGAELAQRHAAADGLQVLLTYTREVPAQWRGYRRRIDRAMLAEAMGPAGPEGHAFVCGSAPFVEAVAEPLIQLGYPVERVKTERFGPSGERT
ncbi:ferredoxin reductase [Deinococcus humi]|uniref:Ferredoxin-NADP reductase n=1 Tax=Deinococcus humi TaxID=662880 RepID=A0A7W8JYI5_9DEIO|nr:ferredoxin reductase [Deinococcus humi]MBB5365320.1 ferredoxin-NADP reductase [Deinococcus humi]GGO36335.1 oxidoreductase [Deinococcus humi]